MTNLAMWQGQTAIGLFPINKPHISGASTAFFGGECVKPPLPEYVFSRPQRCPVVTFLPVFSAEIDAFEETLAVGGVVAALDFLNTRTDYRFTFLYKYEPPSARRILVYDRDALYISGRERVPISHTHFEFLITEATFATRDSMLDARCNLHPSVRHFRGFCGIQLRHADGQLYGWLAHASPQAMAVPAHEAEFLQLIAPALMKVLARPEADRA